MQKRQIARLVASIGLSVVAGVASATSVLDTTTTTAITSGFTDMKDTLLGLLQVA